MYFCFEIDSFGVVYMEKSFVEEDLGVLSSVWKGNVMLYIFIIIYDCEIFLNFCL